MRMLKFTSQLGECICLVRISPCHLCCGFLNQGVSLSFECLGCLGSKFGRKSSLLKTETSLNIIFNVSESGSHVRCSSTRSKRNYNVDMFISCPSMFLDSIIAVFLLVMPCIVSLITPAIRESMNEVLRIVQKSCGGTGISPRTLFL